MIAASAALLGAALSPLLLPASAAHAATARAAAPLAVRDLTVDRATISPNGDGTADAVKVGFRLQRHSGPVAVTIVDAAGVTVRSLGVLQRAGGRATFTWNGASDAATVVADGSYRIVLASTDGTRTASMSPARSLGVVVDTTPPALLPVRPTAARMQLLMARARRKQQLRLPVAFTTGESSRVTISAQVGAQRSTVAAHRDAGRQALIVVLPAYRTGPAAISLDAVDAVGNTSRGSIALALPSLRPAPAPAVKAVPRTPSGTVPVTNVPSTTVGPFPDWLDPIMLRATYGAGVPQSWAQSAALASLVERESAFSPTAQNPGSTAYGLFQFLDDTWAGVGCTKTADAYHQSVCGLRYVSRRYGTPDRALAFWLAQSPHWY